MFLISYNVSNLSILIFYLDLNVKLSAGKWFCKEVKIYGATTKAKLEHTPNLAKKDLGFNS